MICPAAGLVQAKRASGTSDCDIAAVAASDEGLRKVKPVSSHSCGALLRSLQVGCAQKLRPHATKVLVSTKLLTRRATIPRMRQVNDMMSRDLSDLSAYLERALARNRKLLEMLEERLSRQETQGAPQPHLQRVESCCEMLRIRIAKEQELLNNITLDDMRDDDGTVERRYAKAQ